MELKSVSVKSIRPPKFRSWNAGKFVNEYKDKATRSLAPVKYPDIAKSMTFDQYVAYLKHLSYLRTRDRVLEQNKEYRTRIRNDPTRWPKDQQYHRDYTAAVREEMKAEVVSHYSRGTSVCLCCGESELSILTIDHIGGGGSKHRRQVVGSNKGGEQFYRWLKNNGYPAGYQVLCYNCNLGRYFNGGVCPHVRWWRENIIGK